MKKDDRKGYMKDYTVFIGRFQPVHKAHLKVISNALEITNKELIIVVGSYKTPKNIKNPFETELRLAMLDKAIEEEFPKNKIKISYVTMRDYMYSNTAWISSLQNKLAEMTNNSDSVQIIGHFKDDSSYYLNFFPQWKLVTQPNFDGINGTDIREDWLSGKTDFTQKGYPDDRLPKSVHSWIHIWESNNQEQYKQLCDEYNYIENYKKQWSGSPFPPTFVTTDAVVVQSGHILVVKRGMNPGKGRWALPGGFLQNTSVTKSMLNELKEETKIDVPYPILEASIKDTKIFDHPKRSLRGRTITHAYMLKLNDNKPLPKVKGADDADEARWMSFNDIFENEEDFFEDHLHIIQYFINRV